MEPMSDWMIHESELKILWIYFQRKNKLTGIT